MIVLPAARGPRELACLYSDAEIGQGQTGRQESIVRALKAA